MIKHIKHEIYEILYTGHGKRGWKYKIDDVFISTLIILNVIAIIIESFDEIYHSYFNYFHAFEAFSVVVFTIEYLLRLWIADIKYNFLPPYKARLKYIFSGMGLVDLLVILPFYFELFVPMDKGSQRTVGLFRVFRIFKLGYYSKPLQLVAKVISSKRQELLITIISTVIMIVLSATFMYEIEHDDQPEKFNNIFGAFWWAVATLTTIGYGDVVPITWVGQLLAAVTAIFGIALVAIPTGIVSVGFLEVIRKEQNIHQLEKQRNYVLHKKRRTSRKQLNRDRVIIKRQISKANGRNSNTSSKT